MILVLGATGTTGGEVARQLAAAGQKPRLLVRNPAKAGQFQGKAEIVQGEKHLRDSGLAWTMLRPGNFMSNALNWAATIKAQSAFYQPTGEGRWAAIDPADIGAVAVQALTTPGHEGKTYPLTGPESLSAAQYAEKLSVVLGKPVKFVDVPPEWARRNAAAFR